MIVASFLALAVLAGAPSSLAAATAAKAPRASAKADREWPPGTKDESWADKALADPESDQGWMQRCHDDWQDGRVSVCEVRELPYDPGTSPIAIDAGENSGVSVSGSDRSKPRVIYRVRALAMTVVAARVLVSKVRVVVVNGRIRPRGPASRSNERWAVEVKAWVPRSSDLVLEAHNGPLSVEDVKGTMDIQSVNGPVALSGLGGAVSVRVQNGPLSVDLSGNKWSGTGLDAEAQNGPVALRVPRGYGAKLRAGTVNGPLVLDYPIEVERLHGHFATTLGSGGPMVRVVTENGPFTMSER
jgi:hypothetical protein